MSEIQDIIAAASRHNHPMDAVQDAYNTALTNTGKKIWRGMLAVASSGFGKGLLATAAVVLGVTAMVSGYDAYAWNLPFEKGFVAGLGTAVEFMLHGFGIATLAFGGMLGAVSEVRKEQNKITAEVAKVEAQEFAIARERQKTNGNGIDKNVRAEIAASNPWDEPMQNGGFTAREEQRRLEAELRGIRTLN